MITVTTCVSPRPARPRIPAQRLLDRARLGLEVVELRGLAGDVGRDGAEGLPRRVDRSARDTARRNSSLLNGLIT